MARKAAFTVAVIGLSGGLACGAGSPAGSGVLDARTAASVFAWTPFLDQAPTVRAHELSRLRRAGIQTVYVSIDRYADLYDSPRGPARTAALGSFEAGFRALVAEASGLGLRVEALAGNARWGNADERYLPLLLVRFVRRFNASSPPAARLAGINFDIEPYGQADFWDRRDKLLGNYMETVRRLVASAAKAPGLALGLDMPPWFFTGADRSRSVVCWQAVCRPVGWHVLDLLAAQPVNYAVVMAYRNSTGGPDGSVALARPAFAYAASNRLTVGLRIGQEVHAAEPAQITFAGKGFGALRAATAELAEAFGSDPNYRGVAINDVTGLLRL